MKSESSGGPVSPPKALMLTVIIFHVLNLASLGSTWGGIVWLTFTK